MPIADFGLKDKIALVTGASRGIGNAIARGLAEQGARVVLASRKQEALEGAAEEIRKAGGEALAVACHTGKMDMIQALFDRIDSEYGRLDILINNAATNPYFGDVLGIDEGLFDKTIEVNLKGYFFVAQAAAKRMVKQGGGAIVNIASVAGFEPPPMQGVYGMTKAGVITMTRAFAKELAAFGVRVNAICPGLTETHFAKVLIETEAIYKVALAGIPMHRHAQPEEMVGAVIYLASPAASFTTGAVIVVDGGATA
jgi:NAD(P)-dependent dehydrogenase (short-subunit alcohol dehydrogenase family)